MCSSSGRLRLLLPLALVLSGPLHAANSILVAVASNFARPAAEIAAAYTDATGLEVRLSSGSTGKLYAQILNGAPFDLFLAADSERPLLLERSGHIVPGSRMTYATGGLVLWSRDERYRGKDCREALQRGDYDRIALANPDTAPYGAAAREFLIGVGLWEFASRHAVFGENISQALQFVVTGNATLGLVAQSQAAQPGLPAATCIWRVPDSAYAPLDQQAVLLKRASNNQAARDFSRFLTTSVVREIIRRHGYRVAD